MLSRTGNNSCGCANNVAPAWAADTVHSCQGYDLSSGLGALRLYLWHICHSHNTQWVYKHFVSSKWFKRKLFDVVLTVSSGLNNLLIVL